MGGSRLTIKNATDRRGLSCGLRAASQAFLLVCYRPLARCAAERKAAQLAFCNINHEGD